MVNAIPFVPRDVSDTRETSRGLCDLFENTFAPVTKIQCENIEHLVPIANLHETVPVYIPSKTVTIECSGIVTIVR